MRWCPLLTLALATLPPWSAPAQDQPVAGPDRIAMLLQDKNPEVRRGALVPLVRDAVVAEEFYPVLRRALKDNDRQVRQLAAMALASSGLAEPPVLDELVRAMGVEEPPGYYHRLEGPFFAKQALVKLGAKAVPTLVAALEDEKYSGRHYVFDALADLGPAAKDALPALKATLRDRQGEDFATLVRVRWRIDGDDAAAVRDLVPLLDSEEGRSCGGAITILARMGPGGKEAIPAIIQAMRKYRDANLVWGLGELARHDKNQAVPALKEALEDRHTALEAARALRNAGTEAEEMIPALLRMFDRCRDERTDPYRVAYEVVVYDSKAAVPGLIQALKHDDAAVRPAAAWALCRVGGGSKDVISALEEALRDKDAAAEAARSLQLLRDAR